jgi:hypothetical protein
VIQPHPAARPPREAPPASATGEARAEPGSPWKWGRAAGTWWPARRNVGALAILAAAMTGAVGTVLGASTSYLYGAGAYVLLVGLALFFPAAIAAQVIGGQVLVGSILVGQEGMGLLLFGPAVAGIIAAAELLAAAARMDTPFESDPRDDLPRAGIAAIIGVGVYLAVVFLGRLPGPTGLLAVLAASGVCVGLAIQLVAGSGRTEEEVPRPDSGSASSPTQSPG